MARKDDAAASFPEVYLESQIYVETERVRHIDIVIFPIVGIIGGTWLKVDSNSIDHIVLHAEPP